MRASPFAVLAALLAASGPAIAEPCAVTLVISPPSVRDVVAKWVQAEPRCSVALEVRIVPTDGGFYIHARDARGRVRERIVPDGQTAAVLITSWAADDTIAPGTARERVAIDDLAASPPKLRGPEPGVLIDRLVANPPRTVVRATPVPEVAVRAVAPPVRDRISGRTFEIAAMVGTSGDDTHHWGARTAVDLALRGRWHFGVSVAYTRAAYPVYRALDTGDLETSSLSATGYVATVGSVGPLEMRAHAGVGFAGTYLTGVLYDGTAPNHDAYAWPDAFGIYPTAEVAAHLRLIGEDTWQLEVGPYLRWLGESFSPPMPAIERIDARGWEALVDVAVRWKR
jgi:hypothetical protein